MTRTRPLRRATLPAVLLAVLPVVGCAAVGDVVDEVSGADTRTSPSPAPPVQPVPPSLAPSTIGPTSDPDTPSGWGPTVGELTQAAQLVSTYDDAALAAAVLMPGFWGYDGRSPSESEAEANRQMHGVDSAEEALGKRQLGGVFLRPEVIQDADQVRALDVVLHQAGDRPDGLPLLVGIDQEGGAVQRLQHGVDPVPSAQEVGATGDLDHARQVARDNGQALRELGVTLVFAPVADYDPTGYSAMGSRTYSRDLRLNARMVVASMKGYLEAGVIPVVKHFPGIGTVSGDSHGALLHQTAGLDELESRDLVSFRRAIRSGAPVVMTSHIAVDEINDHLASSVDPDVVQGLLRDELGFQGVAVTDSQGMAPIYEPFGSGEGAVRSLLAGEDLVLNSPMPGQAFRAVRRALESGRLPRERLTEAATRVVALRLYLERLRSE
ncbi:glycoside hydrolase family 3 N-terminal domain-containing protein [Nocardioides marmoribigeumensis]|uniref:beta-N-acetylhexosaminidase n=1 Tax=Nocardioides marmoribigeumensis TaxID=433649 RepID=A0ABU2BVM1_9ACTN|nr:glycoside hydrolase family 3 N-terminal domain-containing protein [Nocardioides marmoribigeumensis]MDR7361783.1 beta-N-acetylhexosaminidase [Nocardioides marmoribigeumensis]